MPIDITIRWGGPSDATSGSTYKIERTLDWTSWSTLAAAQAATSPYISVTGALASNASYGATSVVLDDGASFGTTGFAWIDDALIEWAGKSTDTLTGVTWHNGYGTYAAGSTVVVAHESYTDTGVTPTNSAVLYRVTHTDSNANESAPAYIWYYAPPVPASSRHCVVVINIETDLGVEKQAGLYVQGYLDNDAEFAMAGQHLDAASSTTLLQTTNALGLVFFQCWKSSTRSNVGGTSASYRFVLDSDDAAKKVTIAASTIPDRDWVLLSWVGDSVVE